MSIPSGFTPHEWREICGEATALLQRLLRIDTTNPPGNEIVAAEALREVLAADGVPAEILESAPGRGNLVCRLRSGSDAPPLLLAAHTDVVPAGDVSRWRHGPFSGDLAEGMIWGRGAVDMKNMVSMSTLVMKLLARRAVPLKRDVIFAAVADEEAACTFGSRFLVEQHPDKVRAGYALGEVGGFPNTIGRTRLLLVQTAEKGICWLRLTARGQPGHGSVPRPDNAVLRLARAIDRIGRATLPQHNTPVAEAFIRAVAATQGLPLRLALPALLNERLSGLILGRLIADQGQARTLHAQLHNTASPTVLRAGEATNVIPEVATVEIDGRTLPGQTAQQLLDELREVIADDEIAIEITQQRPGTINHPPDSPLWDCIGAAVRRRDPSLLVVPYMIPGFTDAKFFCQLGARWYGFAPVWLEPGSGLRFAELFHGVDERIPEDGFHWGLGALVEVVDAFCRR
jgi:acetylornithine deacetylase/succinyl-diaminopimelate desuccinylase-like protein